MSSDWRIISYSIAAFTDLNELRFLISTRVPSLSVPSGRTLTFAGTGGEGYLVAEFTLGGVVVSHRKADGGLVARSEGGLTSVAEEGTAFEGDAAVKQADRTGPLHYLFSGDGRLVQTSWAQDTRTAFAVWVPTRAVGDPWSFGATPRTTREGTR